MMETIDDYPDEPSRSLMSGKRTVTGKATAAIIACRKCGRTEPREKLWGIQANGITTSDRDQVAYWICSDCF